MTFKLPKIYPITDRSASAFTHLEQTRRLIEGGACVVQLREKEGSSREFLDSAVETVDFASSRGISIIINDRVDIAIAVKAAGVHLGQDDMTPEKARALLGDNAVIGYSTHTLEQARHAAAMPIDYIAIGPIFSTQTKADSDAIVGIDGVRRVRDAIGDIPLVAIGGIDSENGAAILAAGADSVAIISAILNSGHDIARTMRELSDRFDIL